jgi:transposase-like protein
MVRGAVEETLNAMLDAEADQLCGAGRYERSQARQDTRAGNYERTLQTSAGEVHLKVPKLRRQTFETAIIERYRRRESSVEEVLIEMYLAGIEIRRRTRVVGAFPDGQSCLNLAAARLRYIAGTAWSTKRYVNMRPLYEPQVMQTGAVA